MNLDFDVNTLFRERLASSLGLDKYKYIMENAMKINIIEDDEFQKKYNGFYVVRRNKEWRDIYYDLFEKIKYKSPTFEDIITYLFDNTGYIEPSFSSKMLATINSDKPIWDKYVIRNLDIGLKEKSKEEKINEAIKIYTSIEKWYGDFMKTDKARECLSVFDAMLPNYKWISDVKKIDCVLWSVR